MRASYHKDATRFSYAPPSAHLGLLGLALLIFGLLVWRMDLLTAELLPFVVPYMWGLRCMLLGAAALALVVAIILAIVMPNSVRICRMVRRALYCPAYGNPLRLNDGDLLPRIKCRRDGYKYALTIYIIGRTVDTVQDLAPYISASLSGRYRNYASGKPDTDEAYNTVTYWIEDVLADRSIKATDVGQLRPTSPTTLRVQEGTNIDLTTSGSMVVAGKTRSGKTTGIIALLLQALMAGPDEYGSRICVIDPKRAELSRLPGVVTIDEDGGARAILAAMRAFADLVTKRQAVLNELSDKTGDAVHWWDAGMHVSFLFLDEFVALRDIFPKKGPKDDPDYCVDTFDAYLKRIVTMGASAGCYVIISIAEVSVGAGGLPTMLQSAMSTRILFKPTEKEGKKLWDTDDVDVMPKRFYKAGEAWFSSTDGEHEDICKVRFPRMGFQVYRELGRLLREYKTPADAAPSEAEAQRRD